MTKYLGRWRLRTGRLWPETPNWPEQQPVGVPGPEELSTDDAQLFYTVLVSVAHIVQHERLINIKPWVASTDRLFTLSDRTEPDQTRPRVAVDSPRLQVGYRGASKTVGVVFWNKKIQSSGNKSTTCRQQRPCSCCFTSLLKRNNRNQLTALNVPQLHSVFNDATARRDTHKLNRLYVNRQAGTDDDTEQNTCNTKQNHPQDGLYTVMLDVFSTSVTHV